MTNIAMAIFFERLKQNLILPNLPNPNLNNFNEC